jgi:hypothetical protein
MVDTTNADSKGSVAELEIDGKKYTATEVKQMADDLKNNADWKAKNTQESQSIAEMRKQFENYAKLDEYLKANPDKAEKVNDVINGKADTSLDNLDPDDKLKAVLKELNDLKRATKEEMAALRKDSELATARKEMDAEISDAMKKFPDADRREILMALSEGTHESIESLAEKSHKDNSEKEQAIIKKYLDKKKVKTGSVSEGNTPPLKKDKVLGFGDPGFNKQVAETLESLDET